MIAMTPTNDSMTMPPYPIIRASVSRVIILGVVPDATSEWKPEMAPHAIVMNANGNSLPAKTGPSPAVANGVSAGILRRQEDQDRDAQHHDGCDFEECREVVARAE